MPYDLEKYRDKREKVLGVRKRGLSFGAWSAIVSVVMILVMGTMVVPKSIAYFSTRHLDDAIYKLKEDAAWPPEIVAEIAPSIDGVKSALADKNGRRLIVTFDRHEADLPQFSTWFSSKGLEVVLLNRANHRQRLSIEKEESELETI